MGGRGREWKDTPNAFIVLWKGCSRESSVCAEACGHCSLPVGGREKVPDPSGTTEEDKGVDMLRGWPADTRAVVSALTWFWGAV